MWNSHSLWSDYENSKRYYDHVRVWTMWHSRMLLVYSFGGKIFMYWTCQIAMWPKYCIHIWSTFDATRRHKKMVHCEEISHVCHWVLQTLCLFHYAKNAVLGLQAWKTKTLSNLMLARFSCVHQICQFVLQTQLYSGPDDVGFLGALHCCFSSHTVKLMVVTLIRTTWVMWLLRLFFTGIITCFVEQ